MAQTTTSVTQKSCVVSLDTSGGTLTNISGSTTTYSISGSADSGEDSTFEGTSNLTTAGPKTDTVDLAVIYSTATSEGSDILKQWWFSDGHQTERTVQIDVPDSSTGSDRYSGEVRLTGFSMAADSSATQKLRVECTLTCDGGLSWTAIS